MNEYKVDLHGLDAAQAVDALHDTLAKFAGEHSACLSPGTSCLVADPWKRHRALPSDPAASALMPP